MYKKDVTVGYAFCGSYCCFEKAVRALEKVVSDYGCVTPIFSENAASTDTRFGKAEDWMRLVGEITGEEILSTIRAAEPFGPSGRADVLVIAPCTGNTLAKMARGITDSAVTMAAKSQLRNGKPVVIAFSTNDGLSGTLENIAALYKRKNVYFVPFGQDDPVGKPNSLASDFEKIPSAIEAALEGRQLQPVLLASK